MKIQRIEPNGLRGFPQEWGGLDVKTGGAILCGDNGTGKSSVIDSLEIVLKRNSTLFRVDRMGVSWDRGAAHVSGGEAIARCVVRLDDGREITIENNQPDPADLAEWLALARSSSFVLRRHMLLRFIDVQPAQRYQELENFLNLSSFRAAEDALRQNSSHCLAAIEAAAVIISASERRLRQAFDLGEGAEIDKQQLAEGLLQNAFDLALVDSLDGKTISDVEAAVNAALEDEDTNQGLQVLAGLKNLLATLALPSSLTELVESSIEAAESLEQLSYEEFQLQLATLLSASVDLVSEFELSQCPVCEQDVEREALLGSLRERLDANRVLLDAFEAHKRCVSNLVNACVEIIRPYEQFIAAAGDYSTGEPFAAYREVAAELRERKEEIENSSSRENLSKLADVLPQLVASHEDMTTYLDQKISVLGGTDRWRALHALKVRVDLFIAEWAANEEATRRRDQLLGQFAIHSELARLAEEARKQTVKEILDGVAEQANEYYSAIHPEEGLAGSELRVRTATSASVQLISDFHGNEADPALYYSESHQDTLGLCYFLAIRRKEAENNPDFKVLMLDDVLHSVDAAHRRRIAKLLRREFSDHQLIITTHDETFYRLLRQEFQGVALEQIRIGGWSLDGGPVIADSSTDLDRVLDPVARTRMAPEQLAISAGRMMEWVCKALTEALVVNVPAKFSSGHTIGDLWPPLANKLRSYAGFQAAHPDLVGDLDQCAWIRNKLGAHDNEDAVAPTAVEVREFAGLLARLYTVSFCDKCGSSVQRRGDENCACECVAITYSRR